VFTMLVIFWYAADCIHSWLGCCCLNARRNIRKEVKPVH
jgi:hypothetical protein